MFRGEGKLRLKENFRAKYSDEMYAATVINLHGSEMFTGTMVSAR